MGHFPSPDILDLRSMKRIEIRRPFPGGLASGQLGSYLVRVAIILINSYNFYKGQFLGL